MRFYIMLSLLFAGTIMVSCGGGADQQANSTTAQANADSLLQQQLTELYTNASEQLVANFGKNLKSELLSAMNEGGATHAIKICNTAAPQIADSVMGPGWRIRRVTDKFRNPDNRADTAELAILARFADTANFEATLSFWSESDSTRRFFFYEPIRTNQLCLNCHGDIQTLAPGVFDALKKLYPLDRATGYKTGELRGMFAIEAGYPEGEQFARHLALGEPMPVDTSMAEDTLGKKVTAIDSM